MNNNANNQLTNEQALQILFEVTELDQLKLNAKERRTVDLALQTLHKLVSANKAAAETDKVVELTPAPETPTV